MRRRRLGWDRGRWGEWVGICCRALRKMCIRWARARRGSRSGCRVGIAIGLGWWRFDGKYFAPSFDFHFDSGIDFGLEEGHMFESLQPPQ